MSEAHLCTLPKSHTLTLWIESYQRHNIIIRFDNKLIKPLSIVETPKGTRFVVVLPNANGLLTIKQDIKNIRHSWQLEIGQTETVPAALRSAQALKASGETKASRRALNALLQGPPSVIHAQALGLIARLELRLGLKNEAIDHFRTAVAMNRTINRPLAQISDATALVYTLIYHGGQFTQARAVLEQVAHILPNNADAAYPLHYSQGLLATHVGDYRNAMRYLQSAVAMAQRIGNTQREGFANQVMARTLQKVGKHTEATKIIEHTLAAQTPDTEACANVQALNNLAWSLLLMQEAGLDLPENINRSPEELLREALGLHEKSCTEYTHERANILLNLSLATFHQGDYNVATSYLSQAKQHLTQQNTLYRLWSQDIAGRIALAQGHTAKALEAYNKMYLLGLRSPYITSRWRALVGQADARDATGHTNKAHQLYAQASKLLHSESLTVPIHAGRDTFFTQRQPALQRYVESLINADKRDQALAVIRISRAQYLQDQQWSERLSQLDNRERVEWDTAMAEYGRLRQQLEEHVTQSWSLPVDEQAQAAIKQQTLEQENRQALDAALALLSGKTQPALTTNHDNPTNTSPLPGEGIIAYFPLETSWVGFAYDQQELRSHTIQLSSTDLNNPKRLSTKLLTPFASMIERSEYLRFLPYGLLKNLDFHALPYKGNPLIHHKPIIYGLDLSNSNPRPTTTNTAVGLVVSDTLGDLPAARREGEAVGRIMKQLFGPDKVHSLSGDEATASQLRTMLQEIDFLHYAGHGVFAGKQGWESHLPMGNDSQLRIGDILSLKRAPSHVVLSACETGRTSESSSVETTGIASAFIAAGANQVIAPTRPVADTLSAQMAQSYYQQLKQNHKPILAFQQAQIQTHKLGGNQDWASYRLFFP